MQSGEITAGVLNSANKAGVFTPHRSLTVYRQLMFLVMTLLLVGCEFDTEKPGIVVSPTSELLTGENGDTDHFTIVLNSKPDAMVTIPIRSSDLTEGEVSPTQVSFSASNWSAPKTVTVFGVDDGLEDGNTSYSINFLPTQSGDQRYNNLSIAAISAVNEDNDSLAPPKPSIGITIEPEAGLSTSEDLAGDTFTVVLNSQPASSVTIAMSSSDTSEGTVSPTNLTFTTSNWSTAQTVTVTGVDDLLVDGDANYSISFNVQSADSNFNGLDLTPVTAVNLDNDNAGVTVTPNILLTTSETQSSVTFSVVLHSQPASNVTINATSSDTTEGTVNPLSATFTPDNWNTAIQFTVTGVDDTIVDGTIAYSMALSAQSSDANYNGINIPTVQLQNLDNDSAVPPPQTADVVVNPNSGLVTTEHQTSTSFTVALNSAPTSNVIINVISSDISEGLATPGTLTFTPSNWSNVQTVTVTGVDDPDVDGDINYSIGFSVQSTDNDYNGLVVEAVTAVNQDNDSASIILTPASGLATSEDLTSDTFTVVLNSRPSNTVTIAITSSDTSEGLVSPSSLSFTTANWNTAQTVSVTGVDDSLVDGNINYSIGFNVQSSDINYNNLTLTPITVTNQDNDSTPPAGISITPASGLQTSEDLTTDTFTLVLDSQPTSTVTITVSSSDSSEATASPGTLNFTTANWSTAQTVTVTGVDDALVDGSVSYSILFSIQSSDSNYNAMTLTPVSAVNLDNDSAPPAGITIVPASGLQTSENLTTDTFTIVLDTQPTNTVTIAATSSDTSEGTVSPSNLNFTTTNWSTPQTVTITGVNDTIVDGNINYNIGFNVQSSDTNYNGMSLTPVTVVNQDNDTAGITVSPTTGLITSEDLTTDTFTVVLNNQPSSSVNIALTSSDTSEATVSPANLMFTTANWSSPQTVTLTGVDDAQVDGDINYTVSFTVQSTDSNYNAMALTPVSATNQDNDSTPPPTNYVIYIEPGTIDIAASTITNNGAAILPAMGYALSNTLSGQTPGPVIEAVVGQTTTVEVINDHLNPHGFEIEGLLTNTPILQPGETRQFQFTPTQAGVYRYGDPQLLRRALGLQGAVVVRPASNPNTAWTGGPAFDQERTWVISDFDETWLRNPSGVNLTQYNPNYFLMNGQSGFAAKEDPASTIDGTVGETFLIRIVNAGQYDQSLHFHSNHFQIISEGGFHYTNLAAAPTVTTVNVKRGSTAMLLFTLTQTGTYPVHVHTAQMETGNGVYLNGTATFIIGR
ncbi:multicopper oxidase domain-containing protein [Kaarinaea lacus]